LPDPNTGSSTVPTPYKGLNYFGAYLTNPNVPSAPPPIIPNSSPYYVTGQAGKGLGVATDGTTTESFNLDSFYVGCFDARDQEVLYCNFTVTGFNAADERHQGPYLFTFDEPITDFKAPMEKFSVHWTGLEAFDLRVIADDATLARTVLVMDSVEYTINT